MYIFWQYWLTHNLLYYYEWQCGVDANAMDRLLLQSSKPSLHTNIDCNGLVAAVVSRQASVVRLLLQVTFFLIFTVNFVNWSLTGSPSDPLLVIPFH